MNIFEAMEKGGHEQLVFCQHAESGLKTVMGIHDTRLGPGLGGCRMWPYENEDEAVEDALRLSQGMTAKSAAAGADNGGCKVVIWGDPRRDKSETLLRALGRFVNGLQGRVITGTDVGTYPEDFAIAARETPFLVGLPEALGGSGDSSLTTMIGVVAGMEASLQHLGIDSFEGLHVAVQGTGKVGSKLVKELLERGATVTCTDINPESLSQLEQLEGVSIVEPDAIFDVECTIFAPCALGGAINEQTIPRLKCRVVAGSANNQLQDPAAGARQLKERGILYAPDYIINAGGLIQVADELHGFNRERVHANTLAIADRLLAVFSRAEEKDITTLQAADEVINERLSSLTSLRTILK